MPHPHLAERSSLLSSPSLAPTFLVLNMKHFTELISINLNYIWGAFSIRDYCRQHTPVLLKILLRSTHLSKSKLRSDIAMYIFDGLSTSD